MESAHTPGPLYVSAVRITMDGQKWLRVVGEADQFERAFVPFGDRTTAEYRQCMADARLYAAAPDLLAALQLAEDRIAAWEGDAFTDPLRPMIRAAIAKAQGPQNPGESSREAMQDDAGHRAQFSDGGL